MMNLMMVEGSGMEGMNMSAQPSSGKGGDHGPEIKATVNSNEKIVLDSRSQSLHVGNNVIIFKVESLSSKQMMKGLKLKSEVSMASMDMGTDEPMVQEISPGTYKLNAAVSMKGPWMIKLKFPDGHSHIIPIDAK
jgi:hypothetical protein